MENTIENPLDTAGQVVKNAGELAGDGLFGIARFLEQVTGDATSAAIFAAFLLFSLGLIKGAGVSRNSNVYSTALRNVGIVGCLAFLGFCFVTAWGASSVTTETDVLSMGLTGNQETRSEKFTNGLFKTFQNYRWYGAVFLTITIIGFILARVSPKSPQS